MIVEIDVSETGQVTDIRGQALGNLSDNLSHVELARQLQDMELASIVIDRERLATELWEDPRYMRHDTHVIVSEVHEEARRRIQNRYRSLEQVDLLIARFELETRATNYSDESLRGRLQDGFFHAEELALFPEIIERNRHDFQTIYDEDTGEETPRPDWAAEWPTELMRILGPRTMTDYTRVYSIPRPFDHWDSRNRFQQWYLVGHPGTGYRYLRGGSGSSGARLHQGLGAHTFALLSSQGRAIPTWWLRYTAGNQLMLVERFDDFRAVDRELTGNYQVDYRATRHLFDGRLISLPEEP